MVVGSRIPFTSRVLWAWDSVLYARALEQGFHVDFELSAQRPHPPGYILYLALAALTRTGVADSNVALVVVSTGAAVVATIGVFAFARRFASGPAAFIAACAFAVSPLVWLYSEVAYPYTVLASASVLCASALWAMRDGSSRQAVATSLAFGIGAGFRQDLLLLLAPLWIWAVWPQQARWRLVAGAAVGAGIAVWLVPTIVLSGGLQQYVAAVWRQTDWVRTSYSTPENGIPALAVNLGTTAYALGWGLGFAMAPLALAALLWLRPRRRVSARTGFLLLWVVPALGFYVAVHIGEWGYVLSVLPAGFVVLAIALDRACAGFWRRASLGLGSAAAAASILLFVFTPAPFSARTIADHDWAFGTRFSYVRDNFSPAETGILAREDYLLVRHYLPDFRAMFYDPEPYARAQRHLRTRGLTALVVFTPGLSPGSDVESRRIRCATDLELTYVPIPLDAVVIFSGNRYAIGAPD